MNVDVDGRRFAWDDDKAALNLRRHGIAFADAILVFFDPRHTIDLNRGPAGEERLESVGLVNSSAILFVIYMVRYEDTRDEVIRIISARWADGRRRRAYWENYIE